MKREPKIKKENVYKFNHRKVDKWLEGDLTFCNTAPIQFDKSIQYCAVYHAKNPDRKKGHKDYVCLFPVFTTGEKPQWYVNGFDAKELKKRAVHTGVFCEVCGKTLFSNSRHDYKTCGCPNDAMVDGGMDYLRYGAKDMSKIRIVKADMVNRVILKISRCKTRK